MSRKVLLAWELGGGLGHASRLAAVSKALRSRGYDPILVLQRQDSLQLLGFDPGFAQVAQAPLWPGLLPEVSPEIYGPQASMGDALADLGLLNASAIELLIRQWDELFARERPLAVVADFAPIALRAAAGRIPSIAVGSGYTVPPSNVAQFPILRSDVVTRKYEEQVMLSALNTALAVASRKKLERLPEIFAADRTCVASFEETDPYGPLRATPHIAPFLPSWNRRPAFNGKEIFVYFPESITSQPAVIFAIEQLARAGNKVRVLIPRLEPAVAARFVSAGATVETVLVPLGQVAQQTALIFFHGSVGMASFALAAGIPQIIVPIDTEKTLNGKAVERLGAGRCVRLARNNPLEGPLLAQFVLETAANESIAATARSLAPQFARRLSQDPASHIAKKVSELVTGNAE